MNTIKKKKHVSVKYILKMVLWMIGGGVFGFLAAYFAMDTNWVGQFFMNLVTGIQSIMIPLIIVITVFGIIVGEMILKK